MFNHPSLSYWFTIRWQLFKEILVLESKIHEQHLLITMVNWMTLDCYSLPVVSLLIPLSWITAFCHEYTVCTHFWENISLERPGRTLLLLSVFKEYIIMDCLEARLSGSKTWNEMLGSMKILAALVAKGFQKHSTSMNVLTKIMFWEKDRCSFQRNPLPLPQNSKGLSYVSLQAEHGGAKQKEVNLLSSISKYLNRSHFHRLGLNNR
jgi:hypothetical protein